MSQARGSSKHRLSTQDAAFLYAESRAEPMHIGGLAIFQGRIGFKAMIDHLEKRMHLVRRYRQRVRFVPFNLAHPTLRDDPSFATRNHVHCHDLPRNSGEAELAAHAMRVFEQPLDRGRPLWEFHLFRGLEGDRSAVLAKVHHCLVDGLSGVEMLKATMDRRADSAPPAPPVDAWGPAPLPNVFDALMDGAFDRAEDQFDAARRMMLPPHAREETHNPLRMAETAARVVSSIARPTAPLPWNRSNVTQSRSLAWLRYPVAELRAIRIAFGGTVNDVALTALAEGAARYLKHHNHATAGRPLRIGCPVSVRRRPEWKVLGNRVSMMFPETGPDPLEPVSRLEMISDQTRRAKLAGEAQAIAALVDAGELVPPSVIMPALGLGRNWMSASPAATQGGPISFIFTNVPGPRAPQYMAGRQMTDMVGLLPLAHGLGYGAVAMSYRRNLYLGLVAEPNLMPDIDLMKSLVAQVIEELGDAAQRAQSSRPEVHRAAA